MTGIDSLFGSRDISAELSAAVFAGQPRAIEDPAGALRRRRAETKLPSARTLRDKGMKAAAENSAELMKQVRLAVAIVARARRNRIATIDDAQQCLEAMGCKSSDLGNAAGSLFQTPEWTFTGMWTPSTRRTNRCRPVRVWRLV